MKLIIASFILYFSVSTTSKPVSRNFEVNINSLLLPEEKHLANVKQLTFGGENAECYFSFDGSKFVFQSTRDSFKCDQIYTMSVDGSDQRLHSTGKGRTTCAYYMPDNKSLLFSSTHLGSDECPQRPDFSQGYVWALYETYDIFMVNENGTDIRQLTNQNGYDAEATVSPIGDKIVFTSTRKGDIEIFTMNLDGSDVNQITNEIGYDGGPFFSYDGSKVIYRRTTFSPGEDTNTYKTLLSQGLIKPSKLDIWVMDASGNNKFQVTNNGAANFAPFWFPDNKKILFCSNLDNPKSRNFDIYKINLDGTGLERITFHEDFDGFPMFSPDGKKLVFCSNRNSKVKGETNIFICDWID
jgi:Tol biopolymer transport system component